MQDVLLGAAATAGAEIRRGVTVTGVAPGDRPAISVRDGEGRESRHEARLVIAADGRSSVTRKRTGFTVKRDLERMVVAGVMLGSLTAPDDRVFVWLNLDTGREALLVPLGNNRYRAYAAYHKECVPPERPLSGARAMAAFMAEMVGAGVPAKWLTGAEAIGPLASFEGADCWVDSPYKDGVVLLGDAAASNDPTYGQGLSLPAQPRAPSSMSLSS